MPNLTMFIQAEKMPEDVTLRALDDQCSMLCTEMLDASPQNVHIMFVAVRVTRGHPVFAELKYRAEPFRTKQVMEAFMAKLDECIRHRTTMTARIRCFAYSNMHINTCN